MPVRFQVDPDFYDHPKSIGLSDAATALWVRAGSYSVAKLSDGFIAEHVLSTLSRTPHEAAEELRGRGLWHKVRGGYRFHEWDRRNLTRERVEEDRKHDRDRKRRGRGAVRSGSTQNPEAQVSGEIVRPESAQTPNGNHPESEGNPGVSVSVSVSESVSSKNPPAKPARRGRPTDDPDFDLFWATYPKKEDKGHALDMWKRHVGAGHVDPEAVIAGAQRYRDDPRRKPDYTKNASTWLNGLCWEDQPAERPRQAPEQRPFWEN